MAEVYILGEVAGGSGFPSSNIFCKWSINIGSAWKVLEGVSEGQTQVDHPKDGSRAKWCHPIEMIFFPKGVLSDIIMKFLNVDLYIHLGCKGLQGWPKIYFQVYHEDMFGRHELYGYGFHHIPTVPGNHKLDCHTWKPIGSFKDQVVGCINSTHYLSFFMGGGPEVVKESLIYSSNDRHRLRTVAAGTVHFNVGLITKNFEKFGVELY